MAKRKKKTSNGFLFVALIFILMAIILVSYLYISKNPTVIDGIPNQPDSQPVTKPAGPPATNISPNTTVKLAAFNLQIFGTSKADKPEVMDVLSKTIRNFDIVAVQEIRDASQTALPALKNAVNDMAGPKYDFVVSDRLGRTTSKEQYAYFYNTQTMQQIGYPYVYPDSKDVFQREPYISEFKARNGSFDFVLITIHTDPDTATQEINDLPAVVENAKSRYQGEGDFIILGDLNADCNYFNENSGSPLRSSDYYWLINNSVYTTTKSTDCTYDRIIISTPAITDFTENSGVFRFDKAYNLTYDMTISVSDHYPVYAEFWNNRDTD
ncbi:MAG: Endonuclease/Exonuclease/phosphatase family protein [Candidatus Methanoperedens nitroreducens]|uniref:Endonuclease/Exonuclease/phosphatase family protein n=1 Tax=Candidatus Methanoperedens nitratireducens TaxID=1392998 RepID=A0A0N8KR55_9EURY|nr:MAG: Endonuclease/Exonuclease/phosphatase family protein [Candidatus Methanoperedens sp. BLZ1]